MYKARILANLRDHHGKWVAIHCVLRDLPLSEEVQTDIQGLIADGTIEKQMFPGGFDKMNRPIELPMYRYLEYRSAGNKVEHLTVVK